MTYECLHEGCTVPALRWCNDHVPPTLAEKLGLRDATIEEMLAEGVRFSDYERVDLCGRALQGDQDAVLEVCRVIIEEGP